MKTLKEIEITKPDECYLIMYATKVKVNIKKDDIIVKEDLYIFIGLNMQGRRKYVGAYLDNKQNHRYWLDIFEQIKSKGIDDIIFLVVDDNKYLKKCAKVSYPNITTIPLLLEIMDEFYKYFSDKFSTKIRKEIKEMYLLETKEEYENNYDLFTEKYGKNGILANLINKYLKDVHQTYKYDKKIREALFNNYMLKVLKNNIIKLNKGNVYYNNITEIMNLVIEKLNNIESYSSYTKKEWLLILESFYKLYKERIERYL